MIQNPEKRLNNEKHEIDPLPFDYQEVDKAEEADFVIRPFAIKIISKEAPTKEKVLDTKEKALKTVENRKTSEEWYYSDYWREKGEPLEQLKVENGSNVIDIYNFSAEFELGKEYIEQIEIVMQFFAEHFPQVFERCKTILIDDKQRKSAYGDEDKFPFNGEMKYEWKTLILYPNAMKSTSHRTGVVDHFSATLTHELTHFFSKELLEEWQKYYQWEKVDESDLEWVLRPNPSNPSVKSLYNKKNNQLAFEGMSPVQPSEEFVGEYAMLNASEDICESNVVFAFDADKLKKISNNKFDILSKYSAEEKNASAKIISIPIDQISAPKAEPEVVKYYIKK